MRTTTKSAALSLVMGVIVTVFALGLGYLIATEGNSADLTYRSLDYDVQVEDNGDLRITETVDIKLDKREDSDDNVKPWRQLYQTYQLKSSNLTNISDISVKNLGTGREYTEIMPQNPSDVGVGEWNSRYANHWYIADVTYGTSDPDPYIPETDGLDPDGSDERTVEIGWNIPSTEQASSMRFEIGMTWHGVSTAYDDVTKFQWEPFGEKNQTPIGVVRATVRFPEGTAEDESWAWLHYTGNSTTKRIPGGIEFTAYNVPSGEFLDLVVMVDAARTFGVERHGSGDAKQWTLNDEARQEREWHERQHRRAIIRLVIWIVIAVCGTALCVAAVVSAVRSIKAARYTGPIEYWREPPDMSPGAAAKLYCVLNGKGGDLTDRQMAATVMSLVTKGAVAIYPGKAETYRGIDMSRVDSAALAGMLSQQAAEGRKIGKTSTVVIKPRALAPDHSELNLCESEERMLRLLTEAYTRLHSPVFDLKQMSAAFKKWTDGHKEVDKFTTACARELDELHATRSVGVAARACGIFAMLLGVFSALYFLIVNSNLALALCISAPMTIIGSGALVMSRTTGITEQGQEYAGQVQGLARYLEDFSEFSDRGVLDVALWGRYLVYATAFGISKKAMEQLHAAYPELSDAAWLDDHASGSSSLLYWSTRPSMIIGASGTGFVGGTIGGFAGGFGDLGTQLSSGFASVGATITAAAPSSSGGSGGSFSGGGFGGSGGGAGGGSFGGR